MLSLYPQAVGNRTYQQSSRPPFPRKGDRWVNSATGEELIFYIDQNGVSAFVEFADGSEWRDLSLVSSNLILPSNPSLSQMVTHGKKKWQWNGSFWKSLYPVVGTRGGTFSD
jgi:hypothetical protein